MDINDPVNIEYTNIVMALGEEELEAIDKRAFEAEVDACATEVTHMADMLAEHFGTEAVAAALHKVWSDYDAAVGEEE